jgi:hypothetical protein
MILPKTSRNQINLSRLIVSEVDDAVYRQEHLFIGGKGSTRLYCGYSPNTRWPSVDFFRGETFFPVRKASDRERENGHSPRDDHTETNIEMKS